MTTVDFAFGQTSDHDQRRQTSRTGIAELSWAVAEEALCQNEIDERRPYIDAMVLVPPSEDN